MAKVKRCTDSYGVCYRFTCPGCGDAHVVRVEGEGRTIWSFNGDADRPTFSPSLLVQCGHFAPGHTGTDCWCNYEARFGEDPGFRCYRCHSFIRDGRIEFLSDCTHPLAGQTVDLADIPTSEA